ncbi:Metalloenzyme superfamily protein [Pricia antarctica]|uniref:Metalloenzyme superfamily protein n=1 Tax=Pricia antarctica TaxID=641691 RepID=A0A1G7H8X7_9FLAO|nr:sulfatase-like hydrolase/transferase [Pricia antarctica]SDE96868.1 Metalloenzyme superfamily protein [Pricia antarctica]
MRRKLVQLILTMVFSIPMLCSAQKTDDTKIILITLDGFRWQDLFTGADSLLIANSEYVNDTTDLKERFWKETPKARREALMPFFWKEVSKMGQIHGNRMLGSQVDLTNKMWFSYPGYNEILTGKADDARIDSNDKIPNPNTTILEIANTDSKYKGKVAAFGSWDVFPYIVNEERADVPVNAGFELAQGKDLTDREMFLNELQPKVPSPWSSVRFDAFTHYYALEKMKKDHPEFVYISYGETDDFAHDGEYDSYLKSAHTTDALIEQLWYFTQSDPFYKNNTLFIITTDHGRGTEPLKSWKGHGSDVKGAGSVWMILFGKDVSPKGEVDHQEQFYSNQIAPTILKRLGLKIDPVQMKGESIELSTN